MAEQALEISPDCADAYSLLAEEKANSAAEARPYYEKAVEAGERALGAETFEEEAGHFWGILETRPYMRAREGLAECLWMLGEREEAIGHWDDMLRLNPNDNQGLRYPLVGCYLERRNLAGAERLFAEYPEEGSAMFAWAQVLASFLAGDETNALAALDEARGVNKHVEAYLTGRKKTPDDGPGYYSPGEPSEAIVCMHSIGTAWTMHPRAAEWLKRQKPKRK
jgi:tetratricopeptide (TPR) repeat protein